MLRATPTIRDEAANKSRYTKQLVMVRVSLLVAGLIGCVEDGPV